MKKEEEEEIFLELKKAFDTSLSLSVLLQKLEHYFGICGNTLDLFISYLTERKQYVL